MNLLLIISLLSYYIFSKNKYLQEKYIHNITLNSNKNNIYHEIIFEKDKYLNKNNNITLFIEENKYNKYNIIELIILLFNAII
jgi:hypothetical protein